MKNNGRDVLFIFCLIAFMILMPYLKCEPTKTWNDMISEMRELQESDEAMVQYLQKLQVYLKNRSPNTINIKAIKDLEEAVHYSEKVEERTKRITKALKRLLKELRGE